MRKVNTISVAAALGALAMSGSLATAQASPLTAQLLAHGYQVSAVETSAKGSEGKCGEGKCGGHGAQGKAMEGKCGEGKCGADGATRKTM
ncbi:MAG: hypothetical protein R3Y10_08945 [Ferrimonas sp.]